jgi:hypothetical protein
VTNHPVEQEELQALLDKELRPARLSEVEKHVKDCEECAAMIADLQNVSAKLQSWQIEPAPANLKPPVIPPEKTRTGTSWALLILKFAGVASMLLIIVAISMPNLQRSRIAADKADHLGVEREAQMLRSGGGGGSNGTASAPPEAKSDELASAGRLIAYQVTMTIEVKEFESANNKLRKIMDAEGGYIANSDFIETPNQPKRASLVLRVPAVKLAIILAQVRELGRVKEEHMNSEEVTEQVVDLEARLKNARATEQRLIDVLNNRTGKVGDILQVEQEISRTRENIERMEAQREGVVKRVEMATVTLTLAEEFKAELQTAPVGTLTQLWNAIVDGWDNFSGTILAIVFFFARYGLTLLLWVGMGWLGWRMVRPRVKKLIAQA